LLSKSSRLARTIGFQFLLLSSDPKSIGRPWRIQLIGELFPFGQLLLLFLVLVISLFPAYSCCRLLPLSFPTLIGVARYLTFLSQ
jgi:hypothetical protein